MAFASLSDGTILLELCVLFAYFSLFIMLIFFEDIMMKAISVKKLLRKSKIRKI